MKFTDKEINDVYKDINTSVDFITDFSENKKNYNKNLFNYLGKLMSGNLLKKTMSKYFQQKIRKNLICPNCKRNKEYNLILGTNGGILIIAIQCASCKHCVQTTSQNIEDVLVKWEIKSNFKYKVIKNKTNILELTKALEESMGGLREKFSQKECLPMIMEKFSYILVELRLEIFLLKGINLSALDKQLISVELNKYVYPVFNYEFLLNEPEYVTLNEDSDRISFMELVFEILLSKDLDSIIYILILLTKPKKYIVFKGELYSDLKLILDKTTNFLNGFELAYISPDEKLEVFYTILKQKKEFLLALEKRLWKEIFEEKGNND